MTSWFYFLINRNLIKNYFFFRDTIFVCTLHGNVIVFISYIDTTGTQHCNVAEQCLTWQRLLLTFCIVGQSVVRSKLGEPRRNHSAEYPMRLTANGFRKNKITCLTFHEQNKYSACFFYKYSSLCRVHISVSKLTYCWKTLFSFYSFICFIT